MNASQKISQPSEQEVDSIALQAGPDGHSNPSAVILFRTAAIIVKRDIHW